MGAGEWENRNEHVLNMLVEKVIAMNETTQRASARYAPLGAAHR